MFWKAKRVFLTGHTGFKGAWLALWLQSLGAEVVGYSLPAPTDPSLFSLARVDSGIVSITGDVRDLEKLKAEIASHRPEIVIHLAAQSLVRLSYTDPVETYSTNVMGTVNVLEAIRKSSSVRAVVVVTTDKCYENREWVWSYREYEPMGGHDPYSSSKGCAELVTAAYRRSFFNQGAAIASVRAGNVIGGGDWAKDRLIPDIVRAFIKRESVQIRNPHAVRPWQHVLEPLSGYLLLAQRLYENGNSYAEAWNFGPNEADSKSVSWVVGCLTELWGDGATWAILDGNHPHEAQLLKLDISKAKQKLQWHPSLDLREALTRTVEWYRAYANGEDVRVISVDQIKKHQSINNDQTKSAEAPL